MSVYDINGQPRSSLFAFDGQSLNAAYDIEGAQVFPTGPVVNYDNYTITSLYSVSGITSHTQGCDIYNGIIFAFKADNLMYTFRLSSGTRIGNGISCSSGHGGSASFSSNFYSEDDTYPLLYVSSDAPQVYVNRVTTTSSQLIRTLYFSPEVAGYYVKAAVHGNVLYTVGYRENSYTSNSSGKNNVIVSKWDLTNLVDNGDGTYTPTLISACERSFIYVIQFATFHDNMLWVGAGYGNAKSKVYALNKDTGVILHTITLLDKVEIEGASFVQDVDGSYYLVILQWGGVFSKCTFGTS